MKSPRFKLNNSRARRQLSLQAGRKETPYRYDCTGMGGFNVAAGAAAAAGNCTAGSQVARRRDWSISVPR